MSREHCDKCGAVVAHTEVHSTFHATIDALIETEFIGDRGAQPETGETTYHKSDTHHE